MRESFIDTCLDSVRRIESDKQLRRDLRRESHLRRQARLADRKNRGKTSSRQKTPKKISEAIRCVAGGLLGHQTIRERTEFRDGLRMLGFGSYGDYLRSNLWRLVRARVFEVHGDRCFLCPDSASAVHHRQYAALTLIGERLDLLSPVCGPCHSMIEFDIDGIKLTTSQVEEYVASHIGQNELLSDEVSREFHEMFR